MGCGTSKALDPAASPETSKAPAPVLSAKKATPTRAAPLEGSEVVLPPAAAGEQVGSMVTTLTEEAMHALRVPALAFSREELELPLSLVAARLSNWIYHLGELQNERVGVWDVTYEVLSSVESNSDGEDIQKASVAVTMKRVQLQKTDEERAGSTRARAVPSEGSVRVLVVVFRGTVRLQDWLQNVACVDNRVHLRSYGLGVHSGIWTYVGNDFLQHGLSFLDQVSDNAQAGADVLLFTGHSLGGGLACVSQMLFRLAMDHPEQMPCHAKEVQQLPQRSRALLHSAYAITFAAPMVFTPQREELEIEAYLQERTANFVHNNDPVPRFPGELGFIEGLLTATGSLTISLGEGLSVDIGSNIAKLAEQVPVLSRYRHMGVVALIQSDGSVLRGAGADGSELLRQRREPTVGGGIRNWWSDNAYDASLDHLMERYESGVPWSLNVRGWCTAVREAGGTVDLSGKSLGDGGVLAIADCLREAEGATSLLFSQNHIGDIGAAAIASCVHANQLAKLVDLSHNLVGDAGISALAASCYHHETLYEVVLAGNQVTDVGAKAVAGALTENTSIAKLDLSENRLGNEGAVALAEALKKNARVTFLGLASNSIGDDGALAIAEALNANKQLQDLLLASNHVGDPGAVALARSLKVTRTLQSLDLSRNHVGKDGQEAISDALMGWGLIRVTLDSGGGEPNRSG